MLVEILIIVLLIVMSLILGINIGNRLRKHKKDIPKKKG